MADSAIEWTQKVWNPVVGCSVYSPGCTNCYAMKMARRLDAMDQPKYAGLTQLVNKKAVWTGEVREIEEALEIPMRWKKPLRIFVNSMSDLFHESVSDEFISRVFAAMALCPQHTFQVLTKRADRLSAYLNEMSSDPDAYCFAWAEEWHFEGPHFWPHNRPFLKSRQWPLPNVWIGVSVEDQKRAEERIPHLLNTPAAVRWLSCEPLLGPVDLRKAIPRGEERGECVECGWGEGGLFANRTQGARGIFCPDCRVGALDWVVAGGESGADSRPCEIRWLKSLRDQCAATRTPFFCKQLGRKPVLFLGEQSGPHGWPPSDSKGGDINEWPFDIRVRQYPAQIGAADAHR